MRADAPLSWPGTPPGAVYVTLSATDAVDYARLALKNEGHGGPPTLRRSGYACVFAITLSQDSLLPDLDDQEYEANWAPDPNMRQSVASRRVLGGIEITSAVRWALINVDRRTWPSDPQAWPWGPAHVGKGDPLFFSAERPYRPVETD